MENQVSYNTYYFSWHDAMEDLTLEQYGRVSRAINDYCFFGEHPNLSEFSPIEKSIYKMAVPSIDSSNAAKVGGKIGGGRSRGGGAPTGNQNAKKQPETTPPLPKNNKPPLPENNKPPFEKTTSNGNGNGNGNGNVNGNGKNINGESGGGKDPPKTEAGTEEPPPLFSAIKTKANALGFFLDDKDIRLLISKTDPAWFGENGFIEFIAETIRGRPGYAEKPRGELHSLFRKLSLDAVNLREEFPSWRAKLERNAQSEARAKEREDAQRKAREPPTACPGCGGAMAPWVDKDDVTKCLACGSWCVFDAKGGAWEFQELDESWKKPGGRIEETRLIGEDK